MIKTLYDLSAQELINKLIGIAAESAISLKCIDSGTSDKFNQMKYIKGCVLARMEGVRPSVQPGNKVRIPKKATVAGKPLDGINLFNIPSLSAGMYIIKKVWYIDSLWFFELEGKVGEDGQIAIYPANQFESSTR